MSDENGNNETPKVERLAWNADEIASMLSVPVGTVQNLKRTGQLRAVRVGRFDRYLIEDVRGYLEDLKENRP